MYCSSCGYQFGSHGHAVTCERDLVAEGRQVAAGIAGKEAELAELRYRRDLIIKELGLPAREIGEIVGLSHVRVREVINGHYYYKKGN